MKVRCVLGLALGLLMFSGGLSSARASILPGQPTGEDPFILTFDEHGNGVLQHIGLRKVPQGNPIGFALGTIGSLVADPVATLANGGVTVFIGSVANNGGGLTFFLPEPVQTGLVQVFEPPDPNHPVPQTVLTDLLVFRDDGSGSASTMEYYSETEPGQTNPDPADIADLAGLRNSLVEAGYRSQSVVEVGPEGANGFVYPAVGDPGAGPNVYNGVSDGVVPAPPSLLLLASGAGAAGLGGLYRRLRGKLVMG